MKYHWFVHPESAESLRTFLEVRRQAQVDAGEEPVANEIHVSAHLWPPADDGSHTMVRVSDENMERYECFPFSL